MSQQIDIEKARAEYAAAYLKAQEATKEADAVKRAFEAESGHILKAARAAESELRAADEALREATLTAYAQGQALGAGLNIRKRDVPAIDDLLDLVIALMAEGAAQFLQVNSEFNKWAASPENCAPILDTETGEFVIRPLLNGKPLPVRLERVTVPVVTANAIITALDEAAYNARMAQAADENSTPAHDMAPNFDASPQ
jgi:hypothetical protein